jgi:hypothetical protein
MPTASDSRPVYEGIPSVCFSGNIKPVYASHPNHGVLLIGHAES